MRSWGAALLAALSLAAAAPRPASSAGMPGDRHAGPTITFPETLLVQNGGPVIDVRRPPESGMRPAKGDGRTDDTEAFRDVYDYLLRQYKRFGGWGTGNSYYVYLPNGAYRVSDTLLYRGPTVGAYPRWNNTFDINHIHIIGQSREGTVIRLADRCPGFQDPGHPRIVVAFQHPDTVFNNIPGGNWLRNLTIDIGQGNPGAVGLYFQGANNTDLRGVTIRSEDGAGRYGIWFKQGSVQGYYADVTVDGFDDGICDSVNGEGDVAFEYLTLKNQRDAGILHAGGGMSLRRLLSDQSGTGAPALRIDGSGPQSVVIDSELRGGRASNPAIEMTSDAQQCLFARDIAVAGYGEAVRKAGKTAVAGGAVGEYVSYPVQGPAPRNAPLLRSLRLPIADTPSVPWYDPKTQWAIVDDYPSVQAALDSGKPVVCFKARSYSLPGDVTVPASVQFINGMASGIKGGALVVSRGSTKPLLVQDAGVPIRVTAQRDVIQRCATGGISNPAGLPVTFFLENVNDDATGDDFCRPGQRVYARQIDIEYGRGDQIVCNVGDLWIFGFKTENMAATPFTVRSGGRLEILGGYCNTTHAPPPEKQNPLLRNDGGKVSVTLFTNLGRPFVRTIVETQDSATETEVLANTDFPLRGADYRRDYVIPLYVSNARAQSAAASRTPSAGP